MTPADLKVLLQAVAEGHTKVDTALDRLRNLPYEDLNFARLDHHRQLRTGIPEIIYGPGKTDEEVAKLMLEILHRKQLAIASRISAERIPGIMAFVPAEEQKHLNYESLPRLLFAGPPLSPEGRGNIAVVAAGTSDRPVAEEAARIAELLGHTVRRIWDVGVAGLHRILRVKDELATAEVVIVVAGMDGALPSVVAGLIPRPVIAVPTSIGHGAAFQGLGALLAMLNSCAPGVTVVNIDGGLSAGIAAAMINRKRSHD